MSLGLPAGITTAMAATAVAAYVLGWAGVALVPWTVAAVGAIVGVAFARALASDRDAAGTAPFWGWALVASVVLAMLLWPTWPDLLPPGGASDLTHHLMLVDVIERTRHLVDGAAGEAALGEMAHYTPGLHLLAVVAGSLVGAGAFRTVYPLLSITVALKAGFLFLIAYDALGVRRGRIPIALAAVGLVLFVPRAFSLDGFLQAGFFAQVASELFVVAGWWALARWWLAPSPIWMAVAGLMGAAVFLVWPIFVGPLMMTVGVTVLLAAHVPRIARACAAALAVLPCVVVAVLHLSRHAAWLRLAGTSGAVPVLVPGPSGWLLIALALAGVAADRRVATRRIAISLAGGILLQGLALWLLASARGADTPHMAIKMVYLAIYPIAVLGALGLVRLVQWSRLPAAGASWTLAIAVLALGLRTAVAAPLPRPIVDLDLAAAGRWARANLPPTCVDYIVDNAEQAYWLHLAVMGQPRSSARTADIDGCTSNRAVGRWLEGDARPYSVARSALLPGEVLRDADLVRFFGSAVVIQRRGVVCRSN